MELTNDSPRAFREMKLVFKVSNNVAYKFDRMETSKQTDDSATMHCIGSLVNLKTFKLYVKCVFDA